MKIATLLRALVPALAGLCALASPAADKPLPADLIIRNARLITLSSNLSSATAVAVRQDRLIAVGKDAEMDELTGPLTRTIDAQGRTVLPGLYDNHVQSYDASVSELASPSPIFTSIAQAMDYIREQAAKRPAGSWILVDRLYPTRLEEGRLPTLAELDAAAPKNPVYWDCGLLGVANTLALQVSKITNSTRNPTGGELVRDVRTLKPTGLLRNASSLLKIPPARPPTPAQRRDALIHLHQLYNEQGITSIGENRAQPEAIDLFRDLSRNGQLSVRINCARVLTLGSTLEESVTNLDSLTNFAKGKAAYGPSGAGDDWVRIGALRTVVDGDVTTATAYLRAPWGIGPTYQIKLPAYSGVRYTDPEILPDVYVQAAQRGWQLSAHAAGDAAMDSILNCYQYVQFQTNLTQRRPTVTHAIFESVQNWEKCQALGVGAEIQPIWLYKDGFSLMKTLGEKRMRWFLPLKTWFDQGLVIGAGSDHMGRLDSLNAVNPWNPWLGMWITLTRSTQQGTAIHPEECLTREQAIRFYTFNNAWLNFEDKKKGSLEPGKLADLIMIDRDILKCPVADLKETKVLLTMVGGKVVWEARPAAIQTNLQPPPAELIADEEADAPVAVEKPEAPVVAAKLEVPPTTESPAAAPSMAKSAAPAPVAVSETPVVAPKIDSSVNLEAPEAPAALAQPEAATPVENHEVPAPTDKSDPPQANDKPAATLDWSRLSATSAR